MMIEKERADIERKRIKIQKVNNREKIERERAQMREERDKQIREEKY